MNTITQTLEKLHKEPENFERYFAAGEYGRACTAYEHAYKVSEYIEMDDEPRERLLGAFDEDKLQEAFKRSGRVGIC